MGEPLAYMQRTREWYLALGYGNPYKWAHNEDVPFSGLGRPIAKSRVALVTTAALLKPGAGDQGPGAAYNGAAKFHDMWSHPVSPVPDVRISHIAYDRNHTTAEDPRTWFPLEALKQAGLSGRIGSLTTHVYGFPTNRSQRTNIDKDAPALLEALADEGTQAAILVANCPVCHQSMSLAARHLETAGIATVIMGCAKDIVEHCGVPRFVFSDFPLGNAAGKPFDEESQHFTLGLALSALEIVSRPRTTLVSPLEWKPGDDSWKDDYSNPAKLSPEELARRRAEFDTAKQAVKS
ncbi:glycine/sarcosine/betaine reductase selenoprotein B family protein [Anderseniella sp. Alg231-50]|uniref:glycine/sarcosine/betaine reductase selenoprotein B family protein n=1 Tax=Anderseniella sp. Alg231-50 TaxID=1922226 RepID=UPI000D5596D6